MSFRLIFLFIIVSIAACTSDNFDLITEEPLDFEPVELKKGNQITYIFQNQEKSYGNGYGVFANIGDFESYYLSSDTITLCEITISPNGQRTTLNVINRFSDFAVSFDIDPDGNIIGATGHIYKVFGEDDTKTYHGGFPFTPKCSTNFPITLQIEDKTDNFIRGTFEAEFFQSVVDSLIPPVPDNCDDWESVGVMRAAFALPLTKCE